MSHREFIEWADQQHAAGKTDAMGGSFTGWLVAVRDQEGRAVRDELGHQVFESQAAYKARACGEVAPALAPPRGQNLELFS